MVSDQDNFEYAKLFYSIYKMNIKSYHVFHLFHIRTWH